MNRGSYFVLLITLFVAAACTHIETNETSLVEFKVIERSQVSGITFQKFFELRSAQEFTNFWTIHSEPTRTPLPKIDFKQEMVIAVFYGQRQTGGYDIYIHNIEETETELVVNVYAIDPKPGSNLVMMISQPNMIISLPRTDKPVRFVASRQK